MENHSAADIHFEEFKSQEMVLGQTHARRALMERAQKKQDPSLLDIYRLKHLQKEDAEAEVNFEASSHTFLTNHRSQFL